MPPAQRTTKAATKKTATKKATVKKAVAAKKAAPVKKTAAAKKTATKKSVAGSIPAPLVPEPADPAHDKVDATHDKVDQAAGKKAAGGDDFRNTLAKKLNGWQAALILALVVASGALVTIAVKTSEPWLSAGGIVALAFAVIVAVVLLRRPAAPTSSPTQPSPLVRLSKEQTAAVVGALDKAATEVAHRLGVHTAHVRADVFAYDEQAKVLCMVDTLTVRMTAAEKTLKIPPGRGCSGLAFDSDQPAVAPNGVLGGVVHGIDGTELVPKYALDDRQTQKLDPDLAWIVASPIDRLRDDGRPYGTVSLDGLAPKGEHRPSAKALHDIVPSVVNCAAEIAVQIDAPRGASEPSD
jgi:hypothetical protein